MAIDILHLVDRLEKLVEQGRRVPLSSRVMVDVGTFLDIIDQMRISIPEEIKQAKRVQQEQEKAIAEAQEEGARIIARAREEAARLVAEHELRRQAQQRADRILEDAARHAQATHQGADDYAAEVLAHLAEQLAALQRTVANGMAALESRRQNAEEPPMARTRATGARHEEETAEPKSL